MPMICPICSYNAACYKSFNEIYEKAYYVLHNWRSQRFVVVNTIHWNISLKYQIQHHCQQNLWTGDRTDLGGIWENTNELIIFWIFYFYCGWNWTPSYLKILFKYKRFCGIDASKVFDRWASMIALAAAFGVIKPKRLGNRNLGFLHSPVSTIYG